MKNIVYLVLLSFIITSCDDFLNQEPGSNLSEDQVFANVSNVEAATAGAYNTMIRASSESNQGYLSRNFYLITAFSAQDLQQPTDGSPEYYEFYTHQLQSTNSFLDDTWGAIYEAIQATDKIIAYAPRAEGDEATLNRLMAEAYFLRGFHYFNLVRLFGGVPLYLDPITNTEAEQIFLPRAPVEEVYAQILNDLETAQGMMPADYSQPNRASLLLIKALLAKVYLYNGNFQEAEALASEVISQKSFSLTPDFSSIFVSNNESETLLEIPFDQRSGYNALSALTLPSGEPYNGTAGTPLVVYRENGLYPLVELYDSADIRFQETLYPQNGEYYVVKYTSLENFDAISLLRMPEVLLIYAEAAARNAGAVTPEAFEAYNEVRTRAGVPSDISTFTSVDAFINEVVEEKRRELVLEGETWFDYVRAGKAAELGVSNSDYYIYPIPQIELDVNAQLEQNPGY